MTIHVAQGLEFDYVFVISLIDGVFPSDRTVFESDEGMEEERRLCYVAFTRAKKQLFATCNNSYSFVLSDKSKESPFFEEAGLRLNEGYSEKYKVNKPAWMNFPSFDDFRYEEKPTKKEIVTPSQETNNITDWMVGDRIIHDKFGKGVVTAIIDDTIIEVDFDSCGKKSLMSNHKMIHREEKGGDA